MTGTAAFDLGPQARIVARLAAAVPDALLAGRTPCPAYTVGDLLGHLASLSIAFRDAARKDLGATTETPPGQAAHPLPARWREDLPRVLGELAEAWQDPAAWTGMTRAGGVDLPGPVAGVVAVDELVVHGWDVARATGQQYVPDQVALRASHAFLLAAAREDGRDGGVFGAVVPVPEDAPLLDRAIGLSGRDPAWTPPPP
ncbi:TIGR03086 family metal-binding protein [Streptomyces sp. NBC_01439]|uniref:TIGR03086 family metal-binding protein n=1 Tax=Streptomyces sp. NBC_01439 TaxID=2903867 RepID=UPI002E284514|nr:TIGR03086 family metal-binding protein [Streptomyces sp. NBC_01439]